MTDTITGLGPTASATAANAPQTKAVLSSDFETFIKMLTTQAEYQDPLEPLDSSEYAAQLAQFSMVEQQVLSNDLLTALSASLGGGAIGQVAGWIGMEARTTEPVLFSGGPITVLSEPPGDATSRTLVVRNANDQIVDRQPLPQGAEGAIWAGVREDGSPLPHSLYRFEVEATDATGAALPTSPAAAFARITEVRTDGSGATVIFAGGSAVAAHSVTALREAP